MRRFAKSLAEAESGLPTDATIEARVALHRRLLHIENVYLEQQRNRRGGLELGRLRSDMMDDLQCHILASCMARHCGGMKKQPVLTLVALGGCGRRELNPLSDIDFTLLHTEKNDPQGGFATAIKEYINTLDLLGFKLGHSTRNLDMTIAEANGELKSKTAMLESRFLWGDKALYEKFLARFHKECVKPYVKKYLILRAEDQATRHRNDGETVYMQEPNIKSGSGGLRDYQNLLWMARVKYGISTTEGLVKEKYITESERRDLDRAYEWIFRLRTELHYLAERRQDIVFVSQQRDLADRLGYKEEFPDVLRRVEAFMRDYYRHARAIYVITEETCGRMTLPFLRPSRLRGIINLIPFIRSRKKAEEFEGFRAEGGQLHPLNRQIFKEDKTQIMRAFFHMQARGLAPSMELHNLIRRRLKYVDNPFRYLKANREVFAQILSRKGQVGPILRVMHSTGFLGRWLPEFEDLTALVQHEFFHRFTVDEHTIVCAEKLDGLLDTTAPHYQLHKELFLKLEDPYILYLAIILHDTGKAANTRNHITESTMNADRVSRRLKLSREQRALLIFLVDNHDILSRTARNEDVYDAEVIANVANIVQTQQNLDALILLTTADGMGVGDEKLWNSWMQSLVLDLYRQLTHYLADSAGFRAQRQIGIATLRDEVLERMAPDFTDEIHAHFGKMPERYFLVPHGADTAAAVISHIKLVREFLETRWNHDDTPLAPVLRWVAHPNAGHSELWVCTWDRADLLARITGALSAAQLNILSADIFTRTDGIVLDKFRVTTPEFTAVTHDVDLRKTTRLLDAALQVEEYDFRPALALIRDPLSHRADAVFEPRVWYQHHTATGHSTMDIIAPDRPGLLYELLRAITDAGLEISSARITTEKGAAIDTLQLTGPEGALIHDERQLIALKNTLRAIAGPRREKAA